MSGYDPASPNADAFIHDGEILESLAQARREAQDPARVRAILDKAATFGGLSHREAAVLLEVEDPAVLSEVFALARWRNRVSPVIPEAVITRPPSAELRENQTDQDSLPPYEVLDAILARYVDQELSPAEIAADGLDPATIARVLQLVRNNEWKRRQAAPGPKLSRRAFGRERRYPISSGWRD